ncbi:hypothetical protein MMH89_00425 [Candidatus Comchoanobacter bicostacola]|uniref:Uncharacterized protein n=1 Tax=Candidatus Comchoanobacter bicostacola TaxID=2919598 RepID=A0ABY5DJA7_9GAMM|nr:exonuclease domain-containing protein [Candidatus Comchoanobacter bicostacola]UTC24631.1 hypothetical protein MMH89_00425 [Candidatus Comchoanobacter bicostacola]
MSKTLLFYDLETNGLTSLDQILSYASIRVDLNTLELIEQTDIKVQWRRDAFPSLDAYHVHGISIDHHKEGVSECAAIQTIHNQVNQGATLSGGYNTLGFDDGMLRFAFFRNLLPVYTHQYQNNCGRFDVLPLVVFYYLYSPDSLKWPKHPDGRTSFKLEDLNHENKWLEGNAHEALHDVQVTVALAKQLRLNKPMWDYLLGYFDKHIDYQRISDLSHQEDGPQNVGVLVDLRLGSANDYHVPVYYLGPHHQMKNQSVFLRLDQPLDLKDTSAIDHLVVRKKHGEPGFILPYKAKYLKRKPESLAKLVADNVTKLGACSHFDDLSNHFRHLATHFPDQVDVDASLYSEGFLSVEEQSWCQKFLSSGQNGRVSLLSDIKNEFVYKRALRFMWRHFPEQIPAERLFDARSTMNDYVYHGVDHRGKDRATLSEIYQSLSNDDSPEALKMMAHFKKLETSLTTPDQST